MTDDLALALSRAVDQIRAGIREPVWTPLEAMLPPDWQDGFMFMGGELVKVYDANGPRDGECRPIIEANPSRTVFMYKHGITRRYLNIGDDLACYVYCPHLCEIGDPVYRRVRTEEAIAHAFENIEQFGATRTTAYDAEYIAGRNRRLIELGYTVIT